MTTKAREDKFAEMMYPILNGWMFNYYSALPYVCEAVISEKITLDSYEDHELQAPKLVNDDHDLDSVEGALVAIAILSFGSPKWGMFNDLGILEDDANEFGFTEIEVASLFLNDPKGSAQALLDAQKGLMRKGVK